MILIGGNDIKQDTVVKELQYKLTKFCKLIEEVTQVPSKVFMIEPRLKFRGVDFDTYNKIRNSLNRNLQHKEKRLFPDRIVVTPLQFEYLAVDGVHPRPVGLAKLVFRMKRVVGSFLYSYHLRD